MYCTFYHTLRVSHSAQRDVCIIRAETGGEICMHFHMVSIPLHPVARVPFRTMLGIVKVGTSIILRFGQR